eukprot:TRINITY_DN8022_c0_g1_i1.p1 TRINITY_DN8022_c0_g1~~TRINITY_DN8022_c0_g1_i1.p1  ORF type:complete len:265 (+),score=28.95 TRINITY_DN8022_c0_g1_i1:81-875(+)
MAKLCLQLIQIVIGIGLASAAIKIPTKCTVEMFSLKPADGKMESASVTNQDQKMTFTLTVKYGVKCDADGTTYYFNSSTEKRNYMVQGHSITTKGVTTWGAKLTSPGFSSDEYIYGERWADSSNCIADERNSMWRKDDRTKAWCENKAGKVSGQDCIDMYKAVKVNLCFSFRDTPKVCTGTKAVSGVLAADGRVIIVASKKEEPSDHMAQLLDMDSIYKCSGTEVTLKPPSSSGSNVSGSSPQLSTMMTKMMMFFPIAAWTFFA